MNVTLVFDTSALSALLNNDDRLVTAVTGPGYTSMIVPLAVDAETRFGFAHGTRQTDNLRSYELFKQSFGVRIVAPDQDTAIIYADLAAWCRQNGISLSHNDVWIAATCVQSAGKLLTLDQAFARLPQVSLVRI
jgi:predicted nucleic acid-binding protein